jgi:hypothetical protein
MSDLPDARILETFNPMNSPVIYLKGGGEDENAIVAFILHNRGLVGGTGRRMIGILGQT